MKTNVTETAKQSSQQRKSPTNKSATKEELEPEVLEIMFGDGTLIFSKGAFDAIINWFWGRSALQGGSSDSCVPQVWIRPWADLLLWWNPCLPQSWFRHVHVQTKHAPCLDKIWNRQDFTMLRSGFQVFVRYGGCYKTKIYGICFYRSDILDVSTMKRKGPKIFFWTVKLNKYKNNIKWQYLSNS